MEVLINNSLILINNFKFTHNYLKTFNINIILVKIKYFPKIHKINSRIISNKINKIIKLTNQHNNNKHNNRLS